VLLYNSKEVLTVEEVTLIPRIAAVGLEEIGAFKSPIMLL